jgi:hypothetical protein
MSNDSKDASIHQDTKSSRRRFLRDAAVASGTAAAIVGAGAAGATSATAATQSSTVDPSGTTPTDRAPILALIGDRYHNPDYIRVHFNYLFGQMGLEYDYTANYEFFSDEASTHAMLAGRKLFCVFRDGFIFPGGYVGPDAYNDVTGLMNNPPSASATTWVTEGFGQAVQSWVQQGGGLFSYHQNNDVSNFSTHYRDVMGGIYDGHPTERPWQVQIVNKNHPITQGVNNFIVTDEQHFPVYDKGDADLLLRGVNIDGLTFTSDSGATQNSTTSNSGWAYDYGNGRVVYNAVGHNIDALWNPENLKLQMNSIRWLLKEI